MAVLPGMRSPRRRPPSDCRRTRRTALAAVLCATLAVGAPLTLVATDASAAATAATSTTVELVGHGYGHGIGMGQWGSLGYALGDDAGAGNYTYGQILSHFYGGTTLETLGTAPAPASFNDGNVIVAMTENNGDDLIATAASGTVSVAGVTAAATAVLFHLIGPGSLYDVYVSGGCAGQGGWQLTGTAITEPTAVATNGGPVELCQPGPSIEMHGSLSAVATSTEQARTVNTLPLEQYVADVAPSESPSTWATLGGAGPQGQNWGFQQSEAQTVAARSYVEADPLGYGGYADTCDQTCQSYPGMKYETPSSILAAADTAGQVMVINGTSTVATTEYSASSGGYSTGAQFPAVVDAGDAICISGSVCNPNHDWTVTLSDSAIDAAYPAIGAFSSLDVTSRNGDGDFGGRVNQLTLTGTSGSVTVTGSAFAAALNLKSNWFASGRPAQWGHGGLLARFVHRWGLQLRRRQFLRQHRQPGAQQADRRHGVHARRGRLLAGGLRRRGLQLRRRQFLRQHRQPGAQQADRRHGVHSRRGRLLAGGLRRWGLQLRRRPVSTAAPATWCSTNRSSAWRPRPTGAATGWWPPTAASSASATPRSTAPSARPRRPHRWSPWRPRPGAGGYWMLEAAGTVAAFGGARDGCARGRFAGHLLGRQSHDRHRLLGRRPGL